MSDWREQPGDWLSRGGGTSILAKAKSAFEKGGSAAPVNPVVSKPVSRAATYSSNVSNSVDAVEVAEDIVNSLMPLLDALHEVASGQPLAQGSSQRRVVEDSINKLPKQLRDLLAAGGDRGGVSSSSYASQPSTSSYSSTTTAVRQQPAPVAQTTSSFSRNSSDWREPETDWIAQKSGIGRAVDLAKKRAEEANNAAEWIAPQSTRPVAKVTSWSTARPSKEEKVSQPRPGPQPDAIHQPSSQATSRMASAVGTVTNASTSGKSWRESLKTKKKREEEERRMAEKRRQEEEEAKWNGVPAWKRKLLQEKQKKKEEAEAPLREAERKEKERQARFNSLPAWKQALLIKKQQG